jgi:hypothetical protein
MRFGNISMLPDKNACVRIGEKDQLAFIVECRSLSGTSGSPAFVRLAQPRQFYPLEFGGARRPAEGTWIPSAQRFLGLDCGHLPFWSQAREHPRPDAAPVDDVHVETNSGMAIIIPAWRVMDLLMRDDLISQRSEIENDALANDEAQKKVILDSATAADETPDE